MYFTTGHEEFLKDPGKAAGWAHAKIDLCPGKYLHGYFSTEMISRDKNLMKGWSGYKIIINVGVIYCVGGTLCFPGKQRGGILMLHINPNYKDLTFKFGYKPN